MRIFHISDGFEELPDIPYALPESGFLWITCGRRVFEVNQQLIQAALQRLTGGQLVDLHVADLLNSQLPSHFTYTSWYELLIFRRLAPGVGASDLFLDDEHGTAASARRALQSIDTSPVGFAVFDRLLLTVHPADSEVHEFFIERLSQMSLSLADPRGGSRLPPSPQDLMLRIVNHMVDSYLELRRLLTRQLGYLQRDLMSASGRFTNWQALLDSRNVIQVLEDVCEDQSSAVQECIDAIDEWPATTDSNATRERELVKLRAQDILEHIERVITHIRRLQSSIESAVQMHFSIQSNRTNNIMRTLTVFTAIFLPLNLITGIFGMNFDALPLIHQTTGFWLIAFLMLLLGIGLGLYFWRNRYLETKQ